jgi:hypothetical protein
MATMASSEMASADNDNPEKLQDRLKVVTHFFYGYIIARHQFHLFLFQRSFDCCNCLKNVVVEWLVVAFKLSNPDLFCVMKGVQREREEKLARFLKEFLSQYVRGDTEGFAQRAESEAKRLSSTCQFYDPYKL